MENLHANNLMETQISNKIDTNFDLSAFSATSSEAHSAPERSSGGFTIVRSDKNGCRLSLTKKNWALLGNPTTLQFFKNETQLIIGKTIDANEINHSIKEQKGRPIIYNRALVDELIEHFNLDFSANRTSRSFDNIKCVNANGNKLLLITIC